MTIKQYTPSKSIRQRGHLKKKKLKIHRNIEVGKNENKISTFAEDSKIVLRSKCIALIICTGKEERSHVENLSLSLKNPGNTRAK